MSSSLHCGFAASYPGAARGRLLLATPLGHNDSKVRHGGRDTGFSVSLDDLDSGYASGFLFGRPTSDRRWVGQKEV